jgi:AcrR family transcriptional regulator
MTGLSRSGLPRWVELREQQRASVADAVLALVAEGRTQLTVAELAQRAGMSRPTFYKHFTTISAAILHTERTLLKTIEQFVTDNESRDRNSRERLLERFALSFEYTCAHPDVVRFFTFFDFTFERFGLAEADEAEQQLIADSAGTPYLQLFRAGQVDGSIDADLPADATCLALISSLVGTRQRLLVETEWTTGTDQRARDAYSILIDVWRNALRRA